MTNTDRLTDAERKKIERAKAWMRSSSRELPIFELDALLAIIARLAAPTPLTKFKGGSAVTKKGERHKLIDLTDENGKRLFCDGE